MDQIKQHKAKDVRDIDLTIKLVRRIFNKTYAKLIQLS